MAKKAKGNRVQVILECTEQKEYNSEIGADEVQSYPEEDDITQRN